MARLTTPSRTTAEFERRFAAPDEIRYTLRLYVTGMTTRSQHAIQSIKAVCEEHLAGRYDLEVIDIYLHPMLAEGEQIIAAPTLIKVLPAPLRRLVGDLSHTERILLGLDLCEVGKAAHGLSHGRLGQAVG